MVRTLFGITGHKGRVGGLVSLHVKSLGSTEELQGEPYVLRQVGVVGTVGGVVKCVDIKKNTGGEGGSLDRY